MSETVTDYVEKKYLSLEKFIQGDTSDIVMNVEIAKTTAHHHAGDIFRAEVTFALKGKTIRAESEKQDIYMAIDDVRDQVERILVSHKDKKATLWKRGAKRIKDILRLS